MVPDTGEKNALLSSKGKLEPGAFRYYTIMAVNTKKQEKAEDQNSNVEKRQVMYITLLY